MGIVCYALAHLALILPISGAWIWAVFYMVVISFGEIFVMPFSSNWAMSHGKVLQQGKYMGLYSIAYSFANISAPALGTQVISAFGYSALWWLSGVLSIVAWLCFWALEQKGQKISKTTG
ncbi:MAG: MFS transporter [Saprospiraceae bacterium]|nr:MFS transporter [Saprospiraceae bacterium]